MKFTKVFCLLLLSAGVSYNSHAMEAEPQKNDLKISAIINESDANATFAWDEKPKHVIGQTKIKKGEIHTFLPFYIPKFPFNDDKVYTYLNNDRRYTYPRISTKAGLFKLWELTYNASEALQAKEVLIVINQNG